MFPQSCGTYRPTISWSAPVRGSGTKGLFGVKETFLGNQKTPPEYEVCISGEELEASPAVTPPACSTTAPLFGHPRRDVVTTGAGHLQGGRERNREQMGEDMKGGQ